LRPPTAIDTFACVMTTTKGKDEPLAPRRIALDEGARRQSVGHLVPLLADTMALRDLYKKHHWQAAGPTFYELHLLYDKHYKEQVALMDEIAERIQMLGGESVAFPHDVAETTRLERPPRAPEVPGEQLRRLLDAHEAILAEARAAVRAAEDANDDGTVDLLGSHVIPTHEEEAWFIGQQALDRPLVAAPSPAKEAAPQAPGARPQHHA
jgi:starvation-inducible DNA-binding protein